MMPEVEVYIPSSGTSFSATTDRISDSSIHALLVLIITGAFVLLGCRGKLGEHEAEYIIKKHFADRGYTVSELELGDITPPAVSDKGYMGTESYRIRVRHISLTPKGGHAVVFKDATLFIKEDLDRRGNFLVAHIIGIPVP